MHQLNGVSDGEASKNASWIKPSLTDLEARWFESLKYLVFACMLDSFPYSTIAPLEAISFRDGSNISMVM